ncbi:MAG: ParB/RepB/Spo0J family partition protein [Planctomycetota bacterium]|nr:ParB/RepB/Spo0J family partition protein [Planctomycetota bacterium]
MNRNLTQFHGVQISVPLSKLIPNKRNPRRVKPERDAHRQKVASLRAFGLIQPLVVRADDKVTGGYRVIVGNGRLAALRDVYKDSARPPKVPCVLRSVDDDTADALALAENFIREPMHPLDEAEAFAKLAREEAKGVESIAAEFGVSQPYVRQRMKLATLAEPVKAAYRQGGIDTATAEAFASVPADRQLEVWQEVGGNPQHAQHVRNVIAHAWIDAKSATFDVSKLPESAVSKDLFAERVLIERKAFMEAQAEALLAERQKLIEEGWGDVMVGPQADVQDRLYAMSDAPQEYDQQTTAKLEKLAEKRSKLEAKIEELEAGPGEFSESEQKAYQDVQAKLEALDDDEQALTKEADVHYAEATKAVGTAFLLLDPDGRVRRECRIPRNRRNASVNGNGHAGDGQTEAPKPPTSDDLKEPQLATTFTHQALAVRELLLHDDRVRRRVLALILHDKVRGEALSIRHDANGTTVHADRTEGFASTALDTLRKRRTELDPLHDQHYVEDHAAYEAVKRLSEKKLDALIDLLTVECVTAHLQRRTELVWQLAAELGVELRRYWRPDERWLSGYQKIQLAHLIGELRGPVYAKAAEIKKKSELVSELAKLFTDAAEGRMEDAKLAAKLNAWLPSNLREEPQPDDKERASAA